MLNLAEQVEHATRAVEVAARELEQAASDLVITGGRVKRSAQRQNPAGHDANLLSERTAQVLKWNAVLFERRNRLRQLESLVDETWKPTHYSRSDGSTVRLVQSEPFTVENESGDRWVDDPAGWTVMEVGS